MGVYWSMATSSKTRGEAPSGKARLRCRDGVRRMGLSARISAVFVQRKSGV